MNYQSAFWNHNAFLTFIYSVLLSSMCLPASASTAFFYGRPAPLDLLSHFSQVVVEPENIDNLDNLRATGTKVFAYVSIGEVHSTRTWYSEIPQSWFIGSNQEWGSSIIDLTQPGWQDYVLNKYLARLWEQGYRGFFLDGLETYQRLAMQPHDRLKQEKALAELIKSIHERFPGVDLILNRGFDIAPQVGQYAVALAAESLFQRWDPLGQEYEEVAEPDREWLLNKLTQVRDQHELEIIIIDYVDPKQKELARATARKISDLGFTPWVANPALDILGVSAVEVFPRRVLALYDGQEYPDGLQQTDIHKLLAMPIEYLGCTIEYLDVNRGLPGNLLAGQYAGIVTWFNNKALLAPVIYRDWLLRQITAGVKVAIFGNLGFTADNAFLKHLGVEISQSQSLEGSLTIRGSDKIIGYEAKPQPATSGFTAWEALEDGVQKYLSFTGQSEKPVVAVFSGNWGGVALHPYVIEPGYKGLQRWVVNPFEFLSTALGLQGIPVPDVTTDNGRRVLLVQIDGDGAANKAEIPGTPLAIKVVHSQFLQKYPLPSTVSIIEGEIANRDSPEGLSESEKIAQDIFKLDNVEIASHSYSHPSAWFPKNNIDAAGDQYQLSIEGYQFDLSREIAGSVEYINSTLAPEQKPVRVFLWTGDGLADSDALALARSLGLENMNGGGATISNDEQTVTRVPPLGYVINGQLQVYAPIASEQVYTNAWQGPFYGFNRVIETMQLTENPLRLKPMHIHYHFYSGSKIESINALKSVYDWTIEQESRPIWISEYSRKVLDFQNITMSRRVDGAWDIRGLNALRTVRLPASSGWPDLERSKGVVGVRNTKQGRYVHLSPDHGQVLLFTKPDPPLSAYLSHSNGEIEEWQKTAEGIQFQMRAHTPLEVVIGPPDQKCYVNWSGGTLEGQREGEGWKFVFPVVNPGQATLVCV